MGENRSKKISSTNPNAYTTSYKTFGCEHWHWSHAKWLFWTFKKKVIKDLMWHQYWGYKTYAVPSLLHSRAISLAPEMHTHAFVWQGVAVGVGVWGGREGSMCCPNALERTRLPVIFIPSLPHPSRLFICLSASAPASPVPLCPPHCGVYIKLMARILASRSNKKTFTERTETSLSFVILSERTFHISTG